MEAIKFTGIQKKLGDFTLDIPKFSINKGYITGFIGENGAGKTTTIKLIMDMLVPDKGNIYVLGKDIRKEPKIKMNIGYVGEPTGYPEESKLKHIKMLYAPFYEAWDERLFSKYVKGFGIHLDKKYKELSTGQKKQFALVMALAHRPELVILDEPTSGLDPVVRNEILELLMEHMQNEEVSIFYSTHITSDLEEAGDYISYIRDGKIEFSIEKETLLETYCIVKGPKRLFEKEIIAKCIGYRQNSMGGEALIKDKRFARELFGEEVRYEMPTIEDIMVFLSKKGARW